MVVNNAGYGVSGAIEELSEEQARAREQIEVNLFGALWVTLIACPTDAEVTGAARCAPEVVSPSRFRGNVFARVCSACAVSRVATRAG